VTAPQICVTVAGSSCSIPRPGRACSSYLIETPGSAIVADLGTGALANVLRTRAAETIDAVIISHMHADHFIDVIPLRYALKYGARTHDRRVLLYLPPGGEHVLRTLTGAFAKESHHDFIGEVFDVRTYDPTQTLSIGNASVRFAPTSHYIPTFALRLDTGGVSMTYSADTAPDEAIARLAHESNVFLCEATLAPAGEVERPRGHLSAREAATLARSGDVARLVLTHYPASANAATLAEHARTVYDGPIDVADDGYRLAL